MSSFILLSSFYTYKQNQISQANADISVLSGFLCVHFTQLLPRRTFEEQREVGVLGEMDSIWLWTYTLRSFYAKCTCQCHDFFVCFFIFVFKESSGE